MRLDSRAVPFVKLNANVSQRTVSRVKNAKEPAKNLRSCAKLALQFALSPAAVSPNRFVLFLSLCHMHTCTRARTHTESRPGPRHERRDGVGQPNHWVSVANCSLDFGLVAGRNCARKVNVRIARRFLNFPAKGSW